MFRYCLLSPPEQPRGVPRDPFADRHETAPMAGLKAMSICRDTSAGEGNTLVQRLLMHWIRL